MQAEGLAQTADIANSPCGIEIEDEKACPVTHLKGRREFAIAPHRGSGAI
jgi:hypothetical protein